MTGQELRRLVTALQRKAARIWGDDIDLDDLVATVVTDAVMAADGVVPIEAYEDHS